MADEEFEQELDKATANENEMPTLEMIFKILMNVQENTKEIMEDNKNIKKEFEEVKKALDHQSSTIDELTRENIKLKAIATEQERKLKLHKEEVQEFKNKLEELEVFQDEMNQYQRKHNLEIHGIPEKEDEDLEVTIKDLGEVLDVEIEYSDIDIVHRLPSRQSIRPIIVKFLSYSDKKELYEARRKLKTFKNTDGGKLNGATKIYINENLTSSRKRLYAEVRKRVKQNGWFTAWTKDGKIFVKKERGGPTHKITKQVDLEDLY
ncbi:hypothetical protein QZH41_002630 [Actinostola sp. cb2023]|nr:hypothetical protein QZH41_002630 [Actinostola sp. cb2023]